LGFDNIVSYHLLVSLQALGEQVLAGFNSDSAIAIVHPVEMRMYQYSGNDSCHDQYSSSFKTTYLK